MTLFITGVGALIHLYSIGYMHGDQKFSKFFLYLNLFAFSMLMLVLGDNLLLTFLGWEGVGACSYFLISFWFTDEANATAGKKAFVTNRVGDWGFMVAMFLAFTTIGSISTRHLRQRRGPQRSDGNGHRDPAVRGRSRQVGPAPALPLAPRRHGGPDAGVGADPRRHDGHLRRLSAHPHQPGHRRRRDWAPTTIAWVGAVTALFAATIAVAQNDIKKVLAYSTVSPARLHVAGGRHRRVRGGDLPHDHPRLLQGAAVPRFRLGHPRDARRAGHAHYRRLRKLMPITSATFIVGWLAIAGVPPFSGFWSKDEILAYACDERTRCGPSASSPRSSPPST